MRFSNLSPQPPFPTKEGRMERGSPLLAGEGTGVRLNENVTLFDFGAPVSSFGAIGDE
ncbi:hypothetical protein HRbin16_01116 [bacterium HR16]|nr:hypothetical protein HRbin16_01116 [bacterium HR16]